MDDMTCDDTAGYCLPVWRVWMCTFGRWLGHVENDRRIMDPSRALVLEGPLCSTCGVLVKTGCVAVCLCSAVAALLPCA